MSLHWISLVIFLCVFKTDYLQCIYGVLQHITIYFCAIEKLISIVNNIRYRIFILNVIVSLLFSEILSWFFYNNLKIEEILLVVTWVYFLILGNFVWKRNFTKINICQNFTFKLLYEIYRLDFFMVKYRTFIAFLTYIYIFN